MGNLSELLIILVIVLLPVIAQSKVSSSYNKYSKIKNSCNLTGEDVARKILDKNGLSNITIGQVSGNLTDHYDPTRKNINLSSGIYSNTSIAAVAVAAHECGHAIQHKENYSFLVFRTKLVPIVNFTSRISTIFIMIGFLSELANIVTIGIILLSFSLLFQLVTLPVEFDASRRGKIQLKELGLISDSDVTGTEKVLSAAAFTYVAGFLATALQILRLILINRNRN